MSDPPSRSRLGQHVPRPRPTRGAALLAALILSLPFALLALIELLLALST
ncbi:hypothetical protein PVT71_12010 [Salipiger sp. H15]|uniref:Uncharacterized protein n=1 Tax=Alloyangia sp. H15 TaxID=3029062 RepID=A0AAU8AE34_9RHOB